MAWPSDEEGYREGSPIVRRGCARKGRCDALPHGVGTFPAATQTGLGDWRTRPGPGRLESGGCIVRMNDYAQRLSREATSCPARSECPLAFLCATCADGGRYALPSYVDFGYGQMSWTGLSLRSCVFAVRSGLLIAKAYGNDGVEIPYHLSGRGFVTGIPEAYGLYESSSFNYLSGLVPGRLCSFDSSYVRERLDSLPSCEGHRVAALISLNHTTSTYGQLLMMSHAKARDRVVSVLARVDAMLKREGGYKGTLPIAHEDIAFISSLRRTTVSSELKIMADEGMLGLGYRRIDLFDSFYERYGALAEANLPFYGAKTMP